MTQSSGSPYERPPSNGGKGELRTEMVDMLAEIARKAYGRPRSWGTAGQCAERVIKAIDAERSPEQTLVEILGSEQAALDWMREMIPKLEAKLARQQMRQLEQGNGET